MNFCEADIEDYNPRRCGIDYAGVAGIGLININETPTAEQLESPDFWLAAIASTEKKYLAIRNTRGEYSGGEPINEEDLIGTIVTGANHEATFESTGMLENWEYWNYAIGHQWKICIVTSGGLLYYVDKPVSIYTKVNNQKSTKGLAFYESSLKWHDFSNPIILNAPEGIFYGIESILLGSGGFDYTLDFSFS